MAQLSARSAMLESAPVATGANLQVIPEGTGSVKSWFGFLRWLPGRDERPAGSSWSARSRGMCGEDVRA
jgi:hypothetical protein